MGKKAGQKKITVGFVALGCPKNIVDSEAMLGRIAQAGMVIDSAIEQTDVIVINTCGFIKPAKLEAIEAIKQATEFKRKGKVKKVIVAGCLAERMGEELFKEAQGIDAIVGLGRRDDIAKIITETIVSGKTHSYLEHLYESVSDDTARLLITGSHSAYLRISEGCDHKCSFCTIPAIRGRFRSKPMDAVLAEAKELAQAGVVELNIIAQDTAYYGKDLKIKDGLAKLLKEIEKIEGFKWIRLMYLYPVGFTDKLLEFVGTSKKIVHYFDIPIQHVNNQVLKDMRRPDTKEGLYRLIEKLRKALPDVVLRTTLIVGFPGESDEQFAELLEFIKWAKFDALGAFTYYAETGTDAAKMASHVPDKIKQQRLDKLMLAQQKIAFAKNKSKVGSRLLCLVESVGKDGLGIGRYYGQAPGIDSICIIENCSAKTGEFVDVKVVGEKNYDLMVR